MTETMPRTSALLAGASLGMLLGLLIGLSSSPIVSSVVGSLITLSAAILGLRNGAARTNGEHASSTTFSMDLRRLGVAAFGVTCAIAVLAGVALRARDAFALSPQQQVAKWVAAGYAASDAR